jgi:hypothetical protein
MSGLVSGEQMLELAMPFSTPTLASARAIIVQHSNGHKKYTARNARHSGTKPVVKSCTKLGCPANLVRDLMDDSIYQQAALATNIEHVLQQILLHIIFAGHAPQVRGHHQRLCKLHLHSM